MKQEQKLKVFTGFAGYGGDKFALQLANIDYEEVGFSEIDKYAIQCHKQNHKGENFGSITDINPNDIPDFDLFTGGFPCQAFSIAGKGQGVNDEKGRGLLFNHIIRICEVKKPKYILLENVKGLMSKKHKDFFEFTQSELKRIGYNIDVSLFNSKNYGIPQNRERVFYVCIRNDLEFKYDKPIPIEQTKKMKTLNKHGEVIPNTPSVGQAKRIYDKNGLFPSLNIGWSPLVLKDIFETKVENKYFLSDKTIATLTRHHNKIITKPINPLYSGCIHANYFKMGGRDQQYIIDVSQIRRENKPRIYSECCKTLNTAQGGGHTPLTNDCKGLRKLTPKECFRLMGFLKDQIKLEGLSDTQKYKLAGNGWEINLVSKIMRGFLSKN